MYEPNIGYAIVLVSNKYNEDEISRSQYNSINQLEQQGIEGKIIKINQQAAIPYYPEQTLRFKAGDIITFSNLHMITLEGKFAAIKISDIIARKVTSE
jgi:hypothetical protein